MIGIVVSMLAPEDEVTRQDLSVLYRWEQAIPLTQLSVVN